MRIIKKILSISSDRYLEVIQIIKAAGGNARLVGGVVRDAVLGISSSDIDIATDLKPEEVIDLFKAKQIKVIPTGIKYGTVSVIIGNEIFEITTLRTDLDCDGRHATVTYTDSFEEDARRRDFTVNALSYCPINHEIYDYFNGYEDLQNRSVVFIGDAHARIQEDYLRILRFFRFSCRFAAEIDKPSLKACIDHKGKLPALSRERIKSETEKILMLENSPKIISIMYEKKIIQEIFPVNNYSEEIHRKIIKIAKFYQYRFLSTIIFALLLKDSEISLNELIDLKFSRNEAKIIINLINIVKQKKHNLDYTLKDVWLREESFIQYFIFIAAICGEEEFIYKKYLSLKDKDKNAMPVSGEDLIKLGFTGKRIGIIIEILRQKWIESEFMLQGNDLIKLVPKNL